MKSKIDCPPDTIPVKNLCIPKEDILHEAKNVINRRLGRDYDFDEYPIPESEFRIIAMEVVGSRSKGTHKVSSDIDVVVEYEGTMSEDGAFNLFNDPPHKIYGVHLDINPIKEEKSGSLKEWMRNNYWHVKKIY